MSAEPRSAGVTVAVVLAAGAARRFGAAGTGPGGLAAKLVVPFGGRPLVLAAVDAALDAGVDRVRLVVPRPDDELALLVAVATGGDPRVELVASPERDAGLSRSLAAGLEGLEDDADVAAVVVLLGDVPGVTPRSIGRVLLAVLDGAPAARALHDDGPGHPVAFARASLAPLTGLEGDVGARDVLGGLGAVDVEVGGDAPTDVDTPEDLARLLGSAPPDIDEHGSER
jgi:molybdenum cofactor cytidylyltransferase